MRSVKYSILQNKLTEWFTDVVVEVLDLWAWSRRTWYRSPAGRDIFFACVWHCALKLESSRQGQTSDRPRDRFGPPAFGIWSGWRYRRPRTPWIEDPEFWAWDSVGRKGVGLGGLCVCVSVISGIRLNCDMAYVKKTTTRRYKLWILIPWGCLPAHSLHTAWHYR